MEDAAAVALGPDRVDEVMTLVARLRAEVAQLQAEVSRRREHLELRQAGHGQGMHARGVEWIGTLHERMHHLEAEHRQLRQQAFSRQAEPAARRILILSKYFRQLEINTSEADIYT